MKTLPEIKRILEEHKAELRQDFKVKELGIFGSYVRGEQKKQSDLDVLIEFKESANLSLLDFIRLENYLSDVLGGLKLIWLRSKPLSRG